MYKILLATTNSRKIGEARLACQQFDIEVEPIKLGVEEIQHHDPLVIASRKAADAYRLTGKPVVVTDTFWSIPALQGFPGGYMKEVAQWFNPSDFLLLMSDKQDRRISFTETVTYHSAKESRTFSQEYWGKIINEPRGGGNSMEKVSEFAGYTLGERRDQGRFSHDPQDYIWYQFAKWFVATSPK